MRSLSMGFVGLIVGSSLWAAGATVEGVEAIQGAETTRDVAAIEVVEVEIVDVWPAAPGDEAMPRTEASARVTAVLRGDLVVGDELLLRRDGGMRADGERVKVLGSPELEPGSTSILGLAREPDGVWRVVRGLRSLTATAGDAPQKVFPGDLRSLGGKCLDVFQSNPSDGTPVIYFECTGNPNQDWRFVPVGSGIYEIRGLADRCLVPGAVGTTGLTEMTIGPCGTTQAVWLRSGFFPSSFRLVHGDSQQCLDVFDSDTTNGTPIVLFPCTGTANQDWTFVQDPVSSSCVPSSTTLCLQGGRFEVEVDWRDFENRFGPGRIVTQSDDSGVFWFFGPDNWEMLIKVLDACGVNQRYWVFFAATTNVQFSVRLTDTLRDVPISYFNPLGNPASAITDTDAFATCP